MFKKISFIIFLFLVIELFACKKNSAVSKGNKYPENIDNVKVITNYSVDTTIGQMDTLTFGSYPQSDISGKVKEPIEWIVLENDKSNRRALLLSKYFIDNKAYNITKENVMWGTCYLRKWLNDEFYNEAFSSGDKEYILTSDISNSDNAEYGTKGGNNTKDNVFLLSTDEVKKYFNQSDMNAENKRLATKATQYAKNVDNNGEKMIVIEGKGYYQGEEFDFTDFQNDWYYGNSNYWLRSPGRTQDTAARISADGVLNEAGRIVNTFCFGVRPAMWVSY